MSDTETVASSTTEADHFIAGFVLSAQLELKGLDLSDSPVDRDLLDAPPLQRAADGIEPAHIVQALTADQRHVALYEAMFAENADFVSFWKVITLSLKARLRYNKHKAMQSAENQPGLVSLTTSETVSSRHLENARAAADQALREAICLENIERLQQEIVDKEQLLAEQVQTARELGLGWRAIAASAGVNHSTALRRWGSGD